MTKLRTALLMLAGAAGVTLLLQACYAIGVAHASISDPVAIATTSVDNSWSLVESHGPIWGALLLVYGVSRALLKKNESSHWVAQGKTLSIITGSLIVAEPVLRWALGQGDAPAIVMALITAWGLVSHSTVSATPPTTANSQSGHVLGGIMLALSFVGLMGLAILSTSTGCGARQRASAAVGAFLDCEGAHLDTALLKEATAVSTQAITKWIGGTGHVDTAGLKAAAEPLKSDLFRCGFAAAIAALATPTPAQPGAPAAAGVEVDAAQLTAAFGSASRDLGWPTIKVAR